MFYERYNIDDVFFGCFLLGGGGNYQITNYHFVSPNCLSVFRNYCFRIHARLNFYR